MAADPNLVRYVRDQMNAGFRKAQIYDALLQVGWYREEIDAAFYESLKQSSYGPTPYGPELVASQPAIAGQMQGPKLKKKGSKKKLVLIAVLVIVAAVVALGYLEIFNIFDYLSLGFDPIGYLPKFGVGAVSSSSQANGFSGLTMLIWRYQYDGAFSVAFTNQAGVPITINSVYAECGTGGSPILLTSQDPTHLDSGGGITYSSGSDKCLPKEPHESYSVPLTIRYIDDNGAVASATGTVSGEAE